ncbi:hypothetical protein PPYR_13564 [Photinus pyralis]|uniref:DDE Tnp4 domain-containing protein n=1 Tax=Photinus pyralis TaxID=7054 RepID=A0A1Y1JW53_PHOPY|nr:putative nuclease HARBI1 [Photinus pyralis]XP_031354157.1 putative nuclease HARBI1 [Photinus pyralis]KAB0793944.1 hypothetical protein PPYR_13564 [Photinus pyralis]
MAEESAAKNDNSEVFSKQVIDHLRQFVNDPGLSDALHFFTTGEVGDREECILKIASALVGNAPQFIQFPTGGDLIDAQEKFYRLSQSVNEDFGFPNLIGVIDCERVKFVEKEEEGSIKVQFVCGPDLQFYNVLAAFTGQCGNVQIWHNSKLRAQLEHQESPDKCWLIGNSDYFQDPVIMCPIPEAKSEPEKLYNSSHGIVHKCIKRALYLLKKRFKCLDTVLHFNAQEVCAITIACCVLHNICMRHDDFNIDYQYLLLIADLDKNGHIEEVHAKENCSEHVVSK